MTKHLFPVSEYAFTTIPTYPSGQIGFVVCSKDASRVVSKPLREVPNCRYYNSKVHSAAFVLPEFGRAMVEEGKDLLTTKFTGVNIARLEEGGKKEEVAAKKKVLLLGSGYVAGPAAEYILRQGNDLTIGCRTLKTAQELAATLAGDATPVSIDVSDAAALATLVGQHDLVVSLIPYTYHTLVIEAAISAKVDVVTTSYVSPAMKALDEKVKAAGITVMNEIGLDPGIDHVAAVLLIADIHRQGGKVKSFKSYCGGLPAPECSNNPLGYKFSWSSRGVLLGESEISTRTYTCALLLILLHSSLLCTALGNSGKYYKDGKTVSVEGKELMAEAQPYFISPAFAFVACASLVLHASSLLGRPLSLTAFTSSQTPTETALPSGSSTRSPRSRPASEERSDTRASPRLLLPSSRWASSATRRSLTSPRDPPLRPG